MKRIRKLGAALAAGSLAIVLAACSSQGGAQSQPGAARAVAVAARSPVARTTRSR